MGKFDNKKFLVLGTNVGSVDIVNYAKSEGAYVIVADNLPPENPEAKRFADEAIQISTTDINKLEEFGKDRKIDGVFCGVSEMNLMSVMELSKRLKLKCYLTPEAFRLNNDKKFFKSKMQEYGIDYPKEFKTLDIEVIKYPCVVKPIDLSSGIGVKTCENRQELEEAYKKAVSLSPSSCALIEEYVHGNEITAIYTIKDGVAKLSCLKDKFLTNDHNFATSQCDLLLAPSRFLKLFIDLYNEKFIKFIKNELYETGVVFFQGIVEENKIYFIEMGTRMSGGADYKLIERNNGNNFMKMLVNYSLNEKNNLDLEKENPAFKNLIGYLNIFCHKGTIGKLPEVNEILKLDGVTNVLFFKKTGDLIIEDGSLKQNVMRIYFQFSSLSKLKKSFSAIDKIVNIYDVNGNDIRYKHFEIKRLELC